VRISAPTDHPYRTKLITDIGGNWSSVSALT